MTNRCYTRLRKRDTNSTNWLRNSVLFFDSFVLIREIRVFSLLFQLVMGLACACFLAVPVEACTIFVLTDTNRVLFCNNEDWSNPKTRIWFVPGDAKRFGCVCVGFDDGWAQGGLNTEGLAYDWVAGFKDEWKPDPSLPGAGRIEQLLQTCATVEQVIAFYRGHREPGFHYARILVADRTGASVIIGAKDGKLNVEPSTQCRGFGYGARTLDMALTISSPEPIVPEGARILHACLQKGKYATKYSNIFDLKSGDIFLFPAPPGDDQVKFNLAEELKKGGHYYDMPQIHEQLTQPLRPLLANMTPMLLDKYRPIQDKEPQATAHVRAIVQNMLDGTPHAEDYTEELWQEEYVKLKIAQEAVKSLGRLVSLTLVDRSTKNGQRSYRYRVEFEKSTVLQHLVFDEHNKLALSQTEDWR